MLIFKNKRKFCNSENGNVFFVSDLQFKQFKNRFSLNLSYQVACQEAEEEGDEEDEEAEFDGMLIESAGDVIPVMAKLVGGENFLTFFAGFLPDLLRRMVSSLFSLNEDCCVGIYEKVLYILKNL